MPASALELAPLLVEPVRRPVMVQRWTDVVFLHWRYEPAEVQRLLPPGVVVDLHDGSAWVGLVPFSMEGLGLPGLAPLPLVGAFPEVNVRTYVRAGRRRGVWFFSLDVDRLLPVVAARSLYHLPYCLGSVHHARLGDRVVSRVHRRWPAHPPGASAEVSVRPGPAIERPAALVEFLTARWGLVSAPGRGSLRYAPIDHPPWPLHTATVEHLEQGLVEAAGLPAPREDPAALWSPGVPVRVGRPRSIHVETGGIK
jgi:uncharacterized protein